MSVDETQPGYIKIRYFLFYQRREQTQAESCYPGELSLPGAWHHVAMAYKGTQRQAGRIYIDCVSQTLTTNKTRYARDDCCR